MKERDFPTLPEPLKIVSIESMPLGNVRSQLLDGLFLKPVESCLDDTEAFVVKVAINNTTNAKNKLAKNLSSFAPDPCWPATAFAAGLRPLFSSMPGDYGLFVHEQLGSFYDSFIEDTSAEFEKGKMIHTLVFVHKRSSSKIN